MSARDFYHDCVRRALVADGWTITHDPYTLTFGLRNAYVDLGAERGLAAEKEGVKIAVEIKSFLGPSALHDFESALGQFVFYRSLLARADPDRKLFLAVPDDVFMSTLSEPIVRPSIEDLGVTFFAFDPVEARIVRWIR